MNAARFEISACGDDALRIFCGGGDIRRGLAQHLSGAGQWHEVVPGREDITVSFDPHKESMANARSRLRSALDQAPAVQPLAAARHILHAVFGGEAGPDLAVLSERLRRSEAELVAAIVHSPLRVDMLGFTPGFAYLTGLDESLAAERLAHPRPRVPAGSIGLITGQVGLYALGGPGGWPVIGRVMTPLFEQASRDPFVLKPGDSVELVPAGAA